MITVDNTKQQLALQVIKIMRNAFMKRSFRDMARFVCGIATKGELQDLIKRNVIREKILETLKAGSGFAFKKIARETHSSEDTVRRVWTAMCEEYPAEISAPQNCVIAIQKNDRARAIIEDILAQAGFRMDVKSKVLVDMRNGIEPIPYRLVRGSDIPQQLKFGNVQAALVGNDKILEAEAKVGDPGIYGMHPMAEFKEDSFRMCFAIPKEVGERANAEGYGYLEGKTIATSYSATLKDFLDAQGITSRIMELEGDVEAAIRDFGVDVIMDIEQSGNTQRKQGLVRLAEPIFTGNTSLVCRKILSGSSSPQENLLKRLRARLEAGQMLEAA